jgi:Laminin B (Domain IV)
VAPLTALAYGRTPVRSALIPLCVAVLCGCENGPPSFAHSTFETGDEAWRLAGDTATQPQRLATEGNPNGNICGTDEVGGNIWYFVAPQKYLGDVSQVYGSRLTFDLKQSSIFNQIRGRDVVLNGGGLSVVYNMRTAPGTDWTPYSIGLDEASQAWSRDEVGFPPATEADLKTVLRNLNALRIRGEYVDGSDTACLDNVYFGTP